MYRGFRYYYLEGLKASSKTFIQLRNGIKFMMFFTIRVVCLVSLFLMPISSAANVKIAGQIKTKRRIDLLKAFENIDHSKIYWKSFLAGLWSILFFLSGVSVILFFTGAIAYIGQMYNLQKYFAIPGVIFTVLFTLFLWNYLSACPYIINHNPEMRVMEILQKSSGNLHRRGILCIVLINLSTLIFLGLYFALVGYGIFSLKYLSETGGTILKFSLIILIIIGYTFYLPFILGTRKVALYLLFEDRMNENTNGSFDIKLKNIQYINLPKRMSSEEKIYQLFKEEEPKKSLETEKVKAEIQTSEKAEIIVEELHQKEEISSDVETILNFVHEKEDVSKAGVIREANSSLETVEEEKIDLTVTQDPTSIKIEEVKPVGTAKRVRKSLPTLNEKISEKLLAEENEKTAPKKRKPKSTSQEVQSEEIIALNPLSQEIKKEPSKRGRKPKSLTENQSTTEEGE